MRHDPVVGEQVSKSRSFGKTSVSVSGRGVSCYLGAPYSQGRNFSFSVPKTIQQMTADILTDNQTSIGWNVDWENPSSVASWNVPADIWSANGSYMDALSSVAKAAGSFIYSDPWQKHIYFKPLYKSMPRDWANPMETLINLVLPTDSIESESIAWETMPDFNGVYVSGTAAGGVIAHVKKISSNGLQLAPMVTDPLITHSSGALALGRSILAKTGKIATVSLSLPVLPETGIIKPGTMVRYVEGLDSVIGLVKGVSVSMSSQINLRQSVDVEVHV